MHHREMIIENQLSLYTLVPNPPKKQVIFLPRAIHIINYFAHGLGTGIHLGIAYSVSKEQQTPVPL